jgi:hypothetical protein
LSCFVFSWVFISICSRLRFFLCAFFHLNKIFDSEFLLLFLCFFLWYFFSSNGINSFRITIIYSVCFGRGCVPCARISLRRYYVTIWKLLHISRHIDSSSSFSSKSTREREQRKKRNKQTNKCKTGWNQKATFIFKIGLMLLLWRNEIKCIQKTAWEYKRLGYKETKSRTFDQTMGKFLFLSISRRIPQSTV